MHDRGWGGDRHDVHAHAVATAGAIVPTTLCARLGRHHGLRFASVRVSDGRSYRGRERPSELIGGARRSKARLHHHQAHKQHRGDAQMAAKEAEECRGRTGHLSNVACGCAVRQSQNAQALEVVMLFRLERSVVPHRTQAWTYNAPTQSLSNTGTRRGSCARPRLPRFDGRRWAASPGASEQCMGFAVDSNICRHRNGCKSDESASPRDCLRLRPSRRSGSPSCRVHHPLLPHRPSPRRPPPALQRHARAGVPISQRTVFRGPRRGRCGLCWQRCSSFGWRP